MLFRERFHFTSRWYKSARSEKPIWAPLHLSEGFPSFLWAMKQSVQQKYERKRVGHQGGSESSCFCVRVLSGLLALNRWYSCDQKCVYWYIGSRVPWAEWHVKKVIFFFFFYSVVFCLWFVCFLRERLGTNVQPCGPRLTGEITARFRYRCRFSLSLSHQRSQFSHAWQRRKRGRAGGWGLSRGGSGGSQERGRGEGEECCQVKVEGLTKVCLLYLYPPGSLNPSTANNFALLVPFPFNTVSRKDKAHPKCRFSELCCT